MLKPCWCFQEKKKKSVPVDWKHVYSLGYVDNTCYSIDANTFGCSLIALTITYSLRLLSFVRWCCWYEWYQQVFTSFTGFSLLGPPLTWAAGTPWAWSAVLGTACSEWKARKKPLRWGQTKSRRGIRSGVCLSWVRTPEIQLQWWPAQAAQTAPVERGGEGRERRARA